MADNSLEQYLLSRELMEPDRELDKEILETPDLLAKAGLAWGTSKDGIRLVVRARLMKLRQELIFRAYPQEVPVLRQAIVELANLLDDVERYEERHKASFEKPKTENESE